MSAYIRFDAYDPAATTYTLMDGTVELAANAPVPLVDWQWGDSLWAQQPSGPRGTLGSHLAGQTATDPMIGGTIRFYGSSKDDLATRIRAFANVVELQRRYGGQVVRRANNQTYKQYYQVLMTPGTRTVLWGKRAEVSNRADIAYTATVAPYAYGDPLDYTDLFTTDTFAGAGNIQYTADAGALSNFTVTGGVLDAAANFATENRYIYTGSGYNVEDMQVTADFLTPATLVGFKAGVVLKRIDANNYVTVYVDDDGATSHINIHYFVGGVDSGSVASPLGARIPLSSEIWVRGRIEWDTIYGEYFVGQGGVSTAGTPATSTSIGFAGPALATIGKGAVGKGGIVVKAADTNTAVESVEILPYTYKPQYSFPETFRLSNLPGDAPATCNLRITNASASIYQWAAVGWRRFNDIYGLVSSKPTGAPWSVSAVTNINAAATSLAAAATGRYPGEFLNVAGHVTTILGNANSGVARRVFRRFRVGVTYTASVWVKSTTSTANVALQFGNAAIPDVATSANVALSATWQKITVAWTALATYNDAHLGVIRPTAGAADQFDFDIEQIYEATTEPTRFSQVKGQSSPPPFGFFHIGESPTGTVTVDANAMFGFRLDGAAGLTGTVQVDSYVDQGLIEPDIGGTDVLLEVWARVNVPTTCTSLTLIGWLQGTESRYTLEFGSTGRTVTIPNSTNYRYYRVGTILMPLAKAGGRVTLSVSATWAAPGSVTMSIDHVLVLPARSRAVVPSGRTPTTNWLPAGSGLDSEKIVYSDLSAQLGTYQQTLQSPGLAGSLLEIGPGSVEVAMALRAAVPDDPAVSSNDAGARTTGVVHFAITPRFLVMRDI